MKLFKALMMATLTVLFVPVFAQDTLKQKDQVSESKTKRIKYFCPMHPEVTSNKKGICPQCNMNLARSKKGQIRIYACPMKCEGDKAYAKEGKCPVCNMNLREKQMPVAKVQYQCPMKCEGEKAYAKAGKCPVCNMNLREKEIPVVKVQYQCPMKCEGDKTYDKPGNCPVCNMALKEMKEDNANHQH